MKTLIKTLAAATLTLLSAAAFAAPPYYISGTPIVGTATFASSGTCKVPAKKFPNAKYGAIYDSNDNSVGAGVIDANGSAILALEAGGMQSYMKYFNDNNAPQKADMKMRASFMGHRGSELCNGAIGLHDDELVDAAQFVFPDKTRCGQRLDGYCHETVVHW
ncbi:MAG: hypothetical protein R3E61_07780 [Pseudomonadales bacterium]